MLKIENHAGNKLPKNVTSIITKILKSVPATHLRGIDKLRIVDQVNDPRIPIQQRNTLPGLYHPRQGSIPAWLEISSSILFPQSASLYQKFINRFSYKGNLAAIIFSLIGQHYYLTQRHSMRKNQLEGAVRSYTENQLKTWAQKEHGFRSKIFRPLQPILVKWSKKLQSRMKEEEKRKRGGNRL